MDGLIVWDASKGSTLHSILAEESLRWMQVAADGSSVLTASGNRSFVASDLRTEKQLYSFPGAPAQLSTTRWHWSCVLSPVQPV